VVVRNNSVLTGNTAENGTRIAPGGAVAAEENTTLLISGSNVTDNMGLWGGGIYLRNDSSADISEGSIIGDNPYQPEGYFIQHSTRDNPGWVDLSWWISMHL
jgi:hypothetical protein